MEFSKFEILATEVIGADLSRRDDEKQAGFLHCRLLNIGTCIIRNQHISPYDLMFWDNRCTKYNSVPYDLDYTRHMYRTTVIGDIST